MSSTIQQGLLITVIGMGLVFAVIIFLWWLMGMMMRVTSKVEEQAGDSSEIHPLPDTGITDTGGLEAYRRAAGAAVAVGLALLDSQARRLDGEAQKGINGMSPWQSVHRVRQLEQHKKRG